MKKFEAEEILKIHEVLKSYRLMDKEATVTRLDAFLLVASSQSGISPSELCRLLGTNKSRISLILAQLSKPRKGNNPGLELIALMESASDRRRKLAVLTEKGKDLIRQINSTLMSSRENEAVQVEFEADAYAKYSHLLLLY